jgi:hypothetical protein
MDFGVAAFSRDRAERGLKALMIFRAGANSQIGEEAE